MRIIITCGWCHEGNEIPADGSPVYCRKCGHRADTSRMSCDCVKCLAHLDDTLKPVTPHVEKGKCERCGKRVEPGKCDYCVVCTKDLCTDCMAKGCCGNVPALSGISADYGADDFGA